MSTIASRPIQPFRQLNANVPNVPSTSGAQLASGISSSAKPVPASISQRAADQLDGQPDEIANSDQSSSTSHQELLPDREMLSATDSSTDCDEDMIELRLIEEEERVEMQERQGQQKRTRAAKHHKWLRSTTRQNTMVYFKYSDDDDWSTRYNDRRNVRYFISFYFLLFLHRRKISIQCVRLF